ncbi:GNAT family N-acetyltransferase [Paenibacillus lentus]|uniref:GNAT family N-acetyltransferase n=1 Tax=Paenibacillus lentus TaxID=1338368 RepID=A0A3S8RYB3_9BACL|nr:GNAT family N-acetyltransferase [Paenibacillus lentus]AZK47926.1 GNAT family N-acetyltransferase [Paenibacillus lentus]
MKVELKELREAEGQDIFEMIQEIGQGENGFTPHFPDHDFEEFKRSLPQFVKSLKGIELPEGYVPETIYWLYVDDRPVAYGKLRHQLNESLLMYGGHVGYIVRPTERGKGYGKLVLSKMIEQATKRGIYELLITCDEINEPSRKVIERNAGELDSITNGICRYWIKLDAR